VIDSIELGAKLCYGDDNDETIIHASGGTGNFYYSLDNGDDIADAILKDSIFIGEEIGLKRPYVIDEKGCAKTGLQYEYEQPDQFLVDFEFSDIQCHTDTFGNMLLGIQGGTGQYELSINDANFTDVSNVHSINRSTSKDTTSVNLLESNIKLYDGIRYEFYLRDENNCHVQERSPRVNSYTDDFADTIFEIPPILVLVDLDQRPVFCGAENTGKILFEATGGTVTSEQGYILTAYNVNRDESKTNADGTFVVDKLFQGLHKCSLTDAHGCVAETNLDLFPYDTITVAHENEAIQIEITDLTLPTYDCKFDGAIEVDVYDYLFDGVTVKVEHYNEAIEVLKQFDPNDTIVADSDYIRLVNEDDTLYYATQQLVAEYMGIGDYVVTATDIYTSCSVSVPFFLESIGGLDCPDVNNYNVFTPHNNDEENENFTFFGSANQMYSLQVYSAYGELVYSSGEQLAPNDGIKWNGVDNKERPVPVGTYIYLMHLNIGVAGDTIMNGNVTILRADGR
jgi:hypothetical protein